MVEHAGYYLLSKSFVIWAFYQAPTKNTLQSPNPKLFLSPQWQSIDILSERATGSSGLKGLTGAIKSAFPVEKFVFMFFVLFGFFFLTNRIIVSFQNGFPLTSKSSASLGHFFIRICRGLSPKA